MKMKVEELKVGGKDSADNDILRIYARRPPVYCVYQTPNRVSIHYADDPALEAKQRARVARLNDLRNQIDGLIDGWRSSRFFRRYFRGKVERYDARIAAALILCLEEEDGDVENVLSEIRTEVENERQSWGRFEYLISASTFMVLVAGILLFLAGNDAMDALRRSLWLSGIGGVVGAFFSIAVGIKNRTVLTNLQRRDNVADALLRVTIGLIASWVLILLLVAEFLPGFMIGGAALSGMEIAPQGVLIVGFVAGFLERLVPDILAKAGPREPEAAPRMAQRRPALEPRGAGEAEAGAEAAEAMAEMAAAGKTVVAMPSAPLIKEKRKARVAAAANPGARKSRKLKGR